MRYIWIGIDDTDSVKGGCTTHTASVILKRLIDEKFDIIGFPRLVRLNPNIPWKTRGNGAVCFQVGKGKGKKIKIGEFQDKEIFAYDEYYSEKGPIEKIAEIVKNVIDKYARVDDTNTNSGFVISKNSLPIKFYNDAVKKVVAVQEIKLELKKKNIFFKGYKNSRGIIGASASISWNPKKDKTYELIAYREKEKWGSNRIFDDKSTIRIDKKYVSTFDNYDYKNKHNRLVPSSPCPVLYGMRGDKYEELIDAKSYIESESVDSWLIFLTNQGTDDHLQKKKIKNIKSYESVIVTGFVKKEPFIIKGGHVFFQICDKTGKIDCAAYEPTKEFRNIIKKLKTGDKLCVFGGVRNKPLTINLEKIKIEKLTELIVKTENPICKKCGKHMKSQGYNQGFKCKKCGTKSSNAKYIKKSRELKVGFYEVPVCARRHLSKPLKRIYHNAF